LSIYHGAAERALKGGLGFIIFEGCKRLQAKISADFSELDVKALVELKLEGVGALRLEGLEVFSVLRNHIGLRSKDALWLKVKN
jgi:hypothetical protein